MSHPLIVTRLSLWFCALVSSLWAMAAVAHEVVPSIADLTVTGDVLRIEMRLNIEAQLSDIDLDTVSDTNVAENAGQYDTLRALTSADVAARMPDLVAAWNAAGLIPGATLTLQEVTVPEGINIELPRISSVVMTGPAPGDTITVAWPQGSGDLILRQQEVPKPFTGLIRGGVTVSFPAAGGEVATAGQSFAAYTVLGFDHVVRVGTDPLLFALTLFLLSPLLGPLLQQVGALVLACGVGLAFGVLGPVSLPAALLAPLSAASILYLAVENLLARRLTAWRLGAVLVFSLLHGLTLAAAVSALGLPQPTFAAALAGFGTGALLTLLMAIALAALLLYLGCRAAQAGRLQGVEELVSEYAVMFRAWSMTGSVILALYALYGLLMRMPN